MKKNVEIATKMRCFTCHLKKIGREVEEKYKLMTLP